NRDRDEVIELCDRHPVVNVFISSRVREAGLDPARLGGQLWGYQSGGRLTSLCYAGAHLVPVAATPPAITALPGRARPPGPRGPAAGPPLLVDRGAGAGRPEPVGDPASVLGPAT